MNSEKTGRLIAAARAQAGLTQKQLAGRLHISDRTVSRWERGVGFPDLSLLEPLADELGLSVLELLRGEAMPADEPSVPQAEQAVRDTLKTAGEHIRRTVRRFRRALTALAVLLVLASAVLVLLWLNPVRVYRHTSQEVSPARALEVCPFALITAEDFQLLDQLLDDLDLTLSIPESSDAPDYIDLPAEETSQYLDRLHIEGDPVDRLLIEFSSAHLCLDYASGDRRCIVTIAYDGSVRKTACTYDENGDTDFIVENEDNAVFYLGQAERDLLAPLR